MNTWTGILVLLAIIFIGTYGGSMNKNQGLFKLGPVVKTATSTVRATSPSPSTTYGSPAPTPRPTPTPTPSTNVTPVDPTKSKYSDLVYISYISRSTNPLNEIVQIRTRGNASTTIPVTGWTLKSESSGQSVSIPKASYLYFANTVNAEEDIVLTGNEVLYLVTGYSPNGASFKINKCSGYLSQFQNWNPGLPYSCPAPRNENLSSIPKTVNNDACLDYIDNMPSCRIQTSNLPANWSYECTNFIYTKINYPSCIDTHKNDKDFWGKEWRVYLKRNARLWKDKRESIVLYDNEGKIVSKYSY